MRRIDRTVVALAALGLPALGSYALGLPAASQAQAGTSVAAAPETGRPGSPNPQIGAAAAAERMASGDLLLVDVRHPQEWRQTGLAAGAAAISIHDPGGLPAFLRAVADLTGGDRSRPVALICATGVRSGFAADLLRQNGYRAVYNVGEGMLGSAAGPGWLARQMPTEPCTAC